MPPMVPSLECHRGHFVVLTGHGGGGIVPDILQFPDLEDSAFVRRSGTDIAGLPAVRALAWFGSRLDLEVAVIAYEYHFQSIPLLYLSERQYTTHVLVNSRHSGAFYLFH